MNTTMNEIRTHHPCEASWRVLLRGLGKIQADDDPLAYSRIMEICGLDDTLWAIARCHPRGPRICAEFALWCAEGVREHMSDPRATAVLDLTREYLAGQSTIDQLQAARAAACAAARAAACAAAYSAARAAAYSAACAADCAADCAAAYSAARAADCAADCAEDWAAARAEDWAAARAAAYSAQKSKLIALLEEEVSWSTPP